MPLCVHFIAVCSEKISLFLMTTDEGRTYALYFNTFSCHSIICCSCYVTSKCDNSEPYFPRVTTSVLYKVKSCFSKSKILECSSFKIEFNYILNEELGHGSFLCKPPMKLQKSSNYWWICTLASEIDVGQGINVGPGKFGKKNKRRALNTHVLYSK